MSDMKDDRKLSERVTSAFANGYGDEGVAAKSIAGLIFTFVLFISFVVAPIVGLARLGKLLLSRSARRSWK